MDIQTLSLHAPWGAFTAVAVLLLAVGLLAVGRLLARRGNAPALIASASAKKMMPLMAAAASAYEAAKRERMVIVTVAGGTDAAVGWFAQSMAGVVPVYRLDNSTAFKKLAEPRNIGTDLQSLYIQSRDYKTYIDWARSMQ